MIFKGKFDLAHIKPNNYVNIIQFYSSIFHHISQLDATDLT